MWESKFVSPAFVVEGVFGMVNEWKEARKMHARTRQNNEKVDKIQGSMWTSPETGDLKLNVDASVFPGSESFSIGMIIRDHQGSIVAGRTVRFPASVSVFEVETIGIKEALSWVELQQFGSTKMHLEIVPCFLYVLLIIRWLMFLK